MEAVAPKELTRAISYAQRHIHNLQWVGWGTLEEEFAKLREHLYVKFLNSCILLSIFLKMLV
jgi:hypothetical protein